MFLDLLLAEVLLPLVQRQVLLALLLLLVLLLVLNLRKVVL